MPDFSILNPEEVLPYLQKLPEIKRVVKTIQHHHTWKPAYIQFTGNHLKHIKRMSNWFKRSRGFSAIAQHFTVFPDGKIGTGRNLKRDPAGIFGQNKGAISIENFGNFDEGNDMMSDEQQRAILTLTAALAQHFNIPLDTDHIVFHHWFDRKTGKRTDGEGYTKTCPGTAFFGGNSVENCIDTFLPQVNAITYTLSAPTRFL